MIFLIMGASHVGKTALAQKLLEQLQYPYLSIDHLKMGLIRSGHTRLTPLSADEELTAYLWPIVREMIKTAIENRQNLIVEGCYIPVNLKADFEPAYLEQIRCDCLIMTEKYIKSHFAQIKSYASIIESRLDDADCTVESVLADNKHIAELAQRYGVNCVWIDEDYEGVIRSLIDEKLWMVKQTGAHI